MTAHSGRYPLYLLLAALLGLCSGRAVAQTETRDYQLNNRSAEDVAAQVRQLYQGSSVAVTARGAQLVVRGEPELLDEIGRLVETLDVAPVQLRITVRSRTDTGGKRSGVRRSRNSAGFSGGVLGAAGSAPFKSGAGGRAVIAGALTVGSVSAEPDFVAVSSTNAGVSSCSASSSGIGMPGADAVSPSRVKLLSAGAGELVWEAGFVCAARMLAKTISGGLSDIGSVTGADEEGICSRSG